MDKLTRRILVGLLLGVLVYAGLGMLTDAREVIAHASRFPLGVFFGALALTLVNYALRFLKWHLYLGKLGIEVPVGESLTVFIAGMVMAVTPGKVGEVFKSFLLRESRSVPAASTAPIVVAERMTDLLGMVLIAALGVVSFDYGRTVLGVTLVLLVVGIVILNQRELVLGWLEWSGDLPVIGRFQNKLEEAYRSMHELVDLPIFTGTTLLSAVAWSMEGLALYWILVALDASGVTVYAAFFVYAISTIAGAISFLPGGLGVTEGGMIVLLTDVFGYFDGASAATLATYIIRFATLWFGVGLGAVALIWFRIEYGDDEEG
ncbi:MAG: YbhN family protein, partial [Bradymonadaceae bacterium]